MSVALRSIAPLLRSAVNTNSRTVVVRVNAVVKRTAASTVERPWLTYGKFTSPKAWHITAIAIFAATPLGLAGVNPGHICDHILALSIPLHFQIGMTSVIADYIHSRPLVRAGVLGVTGLSAVTALALTYFNLSDVGITEGLRLLWKA